MTQVFEYFKQVGGAFGPSGREDDVREVIGALALDVPAPSTAAYLLFLGGMLLASPLCLAATGKKLPAALAAFALAIILWG